MPPIQDRLEFARKNAKDLFPQADKKQIEKIADFFNRNFQDGYSPDSNDWEEGTHGVGSGATARQYVAYMGECVTDNEPDPNVMPPEEFYKAKHKCLTM